MTLLALTLTLVLTDVPPPPAECRRDTDCELTTFIGCCGACCPGLRAAPVGKNERAGCKTMKCAPDECLGATCQPAPDASQFLAACVAGHCEAVRANAECRVAADCALGDATPPNAVCTPATCCCPVKVARPRLTPATAPIVPRARCATCPAPASARPTCLDGRCQAVPDHPNSKKR